MTSGLPWLRASISRGLDYPGGVQTRRLIHLK